MQAVVISLKKKKKSIPGNIGVFCTLQNNHKSCLWLIGLSFFKLELVLVCADNLNIHLAGMLGKQYLASFKL